MSIHSLLGNLPVYATVAVVFLLMISVLVFAHEMGHYLFARLFKMGVEEFAIGFGKKPLVIYARRKYAIRLLPGEDPTPPNPQQSEDVYERMANLSASIEGPARATNSEVVETPSGTELHETTNFTIRPIPAGGFVRIKGMLPEEDGSETKIPGGFYSKAPWKRFVVLFAGPAFSVMAGILILVPVYMIGGITKADTRPIIGDVVAQKAADKAGLQLGDVILTLQGEPVHTFYDVLKVVRESPGIPLAITFERGGQEKHTVLRPEVDPEPTPILDENLVPTADYKVQAKMFAFPSRLTVNHPSFVQSLAEAYKAPVDTIVGIAKIFQKPNRLGHSVNGPVQMVAITNEAIKDGVLRVLELMAYLSISVGIFNLLPFPPLDGGQMAIALAEMLRGGRRLSMQIQGLVSTAGFFAVVALMCSALWVDYKQLTKPPSPPISLKKK